MFRTTLSCAAISMLIVAAPASAGKDEGQAMEIEYQDLDLSTAKGQKELDRRIEKAARQVCKFGRGRTGTHVPSNERKQCFAQARAAAESQIASATATQQKGG